MAPERHGASATSVVPGVVSGRRRLAAFCLLLALLASACGMPGPFGGASGGAGPPPSGSLSVSFIDVGQGDGVLVQAGGESYLIDAGRPEEGPNVVDFLRDRGVRALDGLVVSNPDADHIGGFLDVFDAFPVETVYLSGDPKGTLTFDSFLHGARDEGSDVEVLRAGSRMDWAGVRADVIAPPTDAEGGLFTETNDNSVAILLTYGTARILLAGDAEAKEEEYMANGPYTGPLTVVRVNKHTQTGVGVPRIARGGRLGGGGRGSKPALSHRGPVQKGRRPGNSRRRTPSRKAWRSGPSTDERSRHEGLQESGCCCLIPVLVALAMWEVTGTLNAPEFAVALTGLLNAAAVYEVPNGEEG